MKFTIRGARENTNPRLTQEQVAKRLGVSTKTYQGYENGKTFMRIDKAKAFSEITGVPISEINFLPSNYG